MLALPGSRRVKQGDANMVPNEVTADAELENIVDEPMTFAQTEDEN